VTPTAPQGPTLGEVADVLENAIQRSDATPDDIHWFHHIGVLLTRRDAEAILALLRAASPTTTEN